MSEVLTSPFADQHSVESTGDEDVTLCAQAVSGNAKALTMLVKKHQRWVYNVALRLVLSPTDAEDLAQESWIRIVTRLSQFQGKSAFRTWAYRIVFNRFMDGKRHKLEQAITTFSDYGQELDQIPLATLKLPTELEPYQTLIVEDAKVGCMLGMLLCLSREQRIVYVLGEIFEAPSAVAAEILEITPATFRKRLERARRDLTSFMNEKCGLLNENNPCRCHKKTQGFIQAGWVDPHHLKFTDHHVARLKQTAPRRSHTLCEFTEVHYGALFREHPILDGPDFAARLRDLIQDPALRGALGLDQMK